MSINSCRLLFFISQWCLLQSGVSSVVASGVYCKYISSTGKYIKLVLILFLLVISRLNAAAIIEASSTGSQAEAIAACEARAASFGAVGCADPGTSYKYGYVYGGNWCDDIEKYNGRNICVGDTYLSFFYFPTYKIGAAYYKNKNSCTVGNPIDPVTGTKRHKESLIVLNSSQNLELNLFYDSSRLNKWTHSYSKRLNFSDVPTGKRFDLNNSGSANGTYQVAKPELPLQFGGVIGDFGKKNTAPGNNGQFYLTKEKACTTGWGSYRGKFNYSWINSSVAEYRLTPISNFGAVGQCYILDAPDGDVKMVLDIYELFSGKPLGIAYANPPGPGNVGGYLRFIRETNEAIVFFNFGGYINMHGTGETVEKVVTGAVTTFHLHTAEDTTEVYNSDGQLVSIISAQGFVQTISYIPGTDYISRILNQTGESLTFVYESYGAENQYNRIKTVTSNDNRDWIFNYDASSFSLISIDLPDGTQREFHYENNKNVQLLTGITDETGNRYATWNYDATERAILSAHGAAKEKDRVEIVYADNAGRGTRIITRVRKSGLTGATDNINSIYLTHLGGGGPIVAEITGNNTPVKFEYDAATGYLDYKIENIGTPLQQLTRYFGYDSRGNPGLIQEAVNTPVQRQTIYAYDPRYHSKIANIAEASIYPGSFKITTNQYDDFGNKTAVIVNGYSPDGTSVTRSTSFEYNGPYYQLTNIDGPRTDVNDIYTIDYYPDDVSEGSNRARMKRVTAPLDITLYDNITYTPTGKIKTYIDANNVQTTLSYYYGNDRLQSLSQVDFNTAASRLTVWSYLATGEVKTITTGVDVAEKTTLTLDYDDARRLISIVDGLGNSIEYILDSEGNVEQENVLDVGGVLRKQLTQTFDDYNRLQLRTQMNEQFTETWSLAGTLDKTVDGRNVTTDFSYDNLRRLTQVNQDVAGTSPQTANALTILDYDVQDNLTYIKNPVNGETIYSYDDLGNQLTRSSDDTGLSTYSHDDAGNITSMVDANGETINYSYDALNRLTTITTSDADDDYQFEYDNCANGVGRLCKVSHNKNSQYYRYDAFGNVVSQQALQYSYDTVNRLKTISYPSGAIVQYDYDAAGHILQVTLQRNGSVVPLASNINYEAFGDITSLVYGNGLTLSQSRDKAYRPLTQSILAVFELNYTRYDANGNLQQRNDTVAGVNTAFGYDEHNRLSAAMGEFGVRRYEYDKNANRTKLIEDTVQTNSSYNPSSNRLSMRGVDNAVLDNNGNMLSLGARGYSYSKHNRLFEVFDSGILKASYQYNGLGQRISKTLADGTGKYFIYDTDGKLMAEIDINGNILFEYIYLNGQLLAKYTPDTDNDGINNYEEDQQGTNPTTLDSDSDGLSDIDEIFVHGTLINNADSDGDGVSDSEEVAFNSDPLNSNVNIGDINLNGEFNLGDYVLLTQFVIGTRTPTATEQAQADLNNDGILNVQDMLLMQRALLGLQISWFDFYAIDVENILTLLYHELIPPAYAAVGDGDIYYVHNDHLGTPVKMTNELGLVVWLAVYDPFGKAVVDEDVDGDGKNVEMNVRFPGQYYDVESGLHYNYFRTYDPDLGRYITSDPIGLFGGVNTYAYVGGDPIRKIDIYGLLTFFDGFSDGFLNQFKNDAPNEYRFFEQYAKNINTDNWTNDIRYSERAWKDFDPYARSRAKSEIGEGCLAASSVNDVVGVASKGLNGLAGLALSSSNSLNSSINNSSFIGKSSELLNIMTYGPSVINQTTWIQIFGAP